MKAGRIDQGRRAEFCRRILSGDSGAAVDLASLYWDAGYKTLAEALLRQTLSGAEAHARAVLGNDFHGLTR